MNGHDDMDVKRALDTLPRSIEPPQDLWPGIRARLPRRRLRRWHWPEAFEPRTIRIAAGIGIIGIGLTVLAGITRANARWYLTAEIGTQLDGQGVTGHQPFPAGSALTTRWGATAVLQAGSIGQITMDQDTRVRLLSSRASEHRLALDGGLIRARISAPPRLFIVETPSGTAVDLGCEYTLHVDSGGNSVIHVTAGWVSFEDRGREALVPAGFLVLARKDGGIGIPVAEDAPGAVLRAGAALAAGVGTDSALALLLRSARPRDAVSLWHLLPRLEGARRAALYERLAALAPPPAGVTREGALRGDPIMMRLWWEALPGTLPITPDWIKRLWTAWLRVASWL